MASVYKRAGTPYWWARFVGYDNKRRLRSTKMRDRKMALRVAAHWETQHALAAAGIIEPEDVDIAERGRDNPVDILELFKKTLGSDNVKRDTANILKRFFEDRRVVAVREFGSSGIVSKIETHLAEQLKKEITHRRVMDNLRAIRRFSKFLWKRGYINADYPLRAEYISGIDEPRILHRALTPAEFEKLVQGPHGLYYRYRVWTGLRGEEVAKQIRGDLTLDDKPLVHVRRAVAKNNLECDMPLALTLANRLNRIIGMKHSGAVLFDDVMHSRESRDDMLQADLVAAGIPTEQLNHRSFRKTFVTWLEAAGVEIGVRMKLRRDIGRGSEKLTNWTYSDQDQVMPLLRDALIRTERWFKAQTAKRKAKVS